jgi:predicted permease
MRQLRLILQRIYAVVFGSRLERDMDEELRFHLRMRAAQNLESGMSPDQARRLASKRFGNLALIKDYCRDIKGGGIVETFLADLRYGIRMLAKSPIFTAVAVLTLALGIGASSAIFSVVNAVLLRSLPFEEQDRLVRVYTTAFGGALTKVTSWEDLADWREQNDVCEQLAAFSSGSEPLTGAGQPEQVPTGYAGDGFFQVFRVNPILGRTFSPDECVRGSGTGSVLILGEGFWKQRFGSDPNVIGQSLAVDGLSTTVIGVVPDRFDTVVGQAGIWLPFKSREQPRINRYVNVVGRLKPGVGVKQAAADMEGIAARLEQLYPDSNHGWKASVRSLMDWIVVDVRLMLFVLSGAVGLVLLIACANVANLLLARAATRSQEVAVRSALGASRGRLIRQLLTEGLLLSTLGGVVGILVASAAVRFLIKLDPGNIPRLGDVGLDTRVIGFTVLLSLGTTIIFGLAPALRISQTSLIETIKDAGRGPQRGRRHARIRNFLVVSELAFSLMLLIGCGLLMRSFYRLSSVKSGLDPDNVTTAKITLPSSRYGTPESSSLFYDRLLERIRALPGAGSAAVCSLLPFSGGGSVEWWGSVPEGQPFTPEASVVAQHRRVSPGYFRTMQIPLVEGRDIDEFDRENRPPVVILSQSMARRLWPGDDPIGKRILFNPQGPPTEVVGVVSDVTWAGLEIPDDMATYVPFAQEPFNHMVIVARGATEHANLAGAMKELVQTIDKEVPVHDIKTLNQFRDKTLSGHRFNLLLLSIFAGVALMLAAVGTYGVISYSVAERTQEIGLRLALGAARSDVIALVVGQSARLAFIGVAFGLAGAFAVTRVLESVLYKVKPTDPATFAAVSVFLLIVSVVAAYVPVKRAARIDPMVALRYE